MRTLILVFFTAFVLSLGYMAYWWMQPAKLAKVGKAKGEGQPALALAKPNGDQPVGPGKRVWVKKFDEDTAKLASRFRADDYTPRADGWVVVKQPRAQFFMKDGRAITIQGDSGEVIMDEQKGGKGMKALSGSRETPSRGRLFNVTIKLYHNIENPEAELDEDRPKGAKAAAVAAPEVGMTITLNNASFDNQTFKIYSEGYGKGKNHVAPDEVPVTLRGEEYDYDGRGLTIRWNERDRRLQLLEIAHGERLVIKRPDAFMKKQDDAVAEEWMRGWGGEGMRGGGGIPLPVMLAAKTVEAAGEAIQQAAPAPATARSSRGRRARPALPKPKITPSDAPPLYRATFHENVKVVQGADLGVTSNKMSVDFLLQDQGDSSDQAAGTNRAAGKRARKGRAATEPTTQVAVAAATRPVGATTQASARRVRRAAQAGSATQPTEKPIVITWTGKMVVEPLVLSSENPIKDGEAIVRLEGTPVTATQQGSTILAGTLTYRTEDQAMLLTPVGPDQPVVMKDTKGSEVRTTRMDYYQPKRQAILYGASNAVFPQADESGKPGAPMLANWSKTCTLYFAPSEPGAAAGGGAGDALGGGGAMNIERAELDGDVKVDHPQLKLRSNALDLVFDTAKEATGATTRPVAAMQVAGASTRPTTRPAGVRTDLRQLVATGAVHAEMADASKKGQTIDCDRLTLQTAKTADGRSYPNIVNADGDVRAVDAEQDLRAGHLAVTLRPSTRPTAATTRPGGGAAGDAVLAGGAGGAKETASVELQSMVAHQNVVVVSKDGTRTTADQLLVDVKDGHNNLKLLGQPYASIVDKKNTLTGSIIEIFPDAQQLQVVGAGTMKGVQQEKDTGAAERPMDVSWQRGMVFDGKANTVDLSGQVAAVTTDAEGALNTARGERVRMLLADAAPTTRPTTPQATTQATALALATTRPTTRPAKAGPESAMASKTVRHITFDENATVSSESWGTDGALLRRTHLEASTLQYDLLAKRMVIPVPGRMIVQDHRPTSQPTTGATVVGGAAAEARPAAAAAAPGGLGGGNNRGSTAFQWTKSFTYDDVEHQAVMTGDERNPVVVVHRDDSPKAQTFRLEGQTVTADLASVMPVAPGAAAATAAATKPVKPEQKMQLKRVTAAGRLVFTGPGAEIHALNMEFDPTTNWLVARGNEREPVNFSFSSQPGGARVAEEVQYNLDSGEVKSTKVMMRGAR